MVAGSHPVKAMATGCQSCSYGVAIGESNPSCPAKTLMLVKQKCQEYHIIMGTYGEAVKRAYLRNVHWGAEQLRSFYKAEAENE